MFVSCYICEPFCHFASHPWNWIQEVRPPYGPEEQPVADASPGVKLGRSFLLEHSQGTTQKCYHQILVAESHHLIWKQTIFNWRFSCPKVAATRTMREINQMFAYRLPQTVAWLFVGFGSTFAAENF